MEAAVFCSTVWMLHYHAVPGQLSINVCRPGLLS